MVKTVKAVAPVRPKWLTLNRYRFLEAENALLMEQRGALRDELKSLREANRQKQALIEYMVQCQKTEG